MKRLVSTVLLLSVLIGRAEAAADCTAQTQLDVATVKTQVFVVGEMHGTAEVPVFVGGLVCSLLQAGRPVMLALERPSSEQAALDRYIESDGSEAERQALLGQGMWVWPMQDGRNSRAMLALIESVRVLRRAGQPIGILAMQHQADPRLPRDRRAMVLAHDLASRMNDRLMADSIAAFFAEHGDYTVVAFAGDYHTATVAPTGTGPGYRPMAQVLEEFLPIFVVGLASTEPGTVWMCSRSNDCGVHPAIQQPLFIEGTRIDAEVKLGRLSASEPAARPSK
ncbi:hypothetical protein SNE35_06685 [Paucibacter sp. R3-3]|uniref:Haem-binding uptake Tiki superfamily ChaN domain-containing protein n=1 Tax=Roseateles agri TaxID=3098619 RepID=A0ABU5DEJ4_9BURK|nr:hypothetical protein [Paucibacter sp. R3-3]MDY0744183.1 hypothetical protein [Paucibacter sp. R3-3]